MGGHSLFVSPRTFKVWLYVASHRTLLLRSVRDNQIATRIDLLFKPCDRLHLPTTIIGVDVRSIEPSRVSFAAQNVFTLTGDDIEAWVAADVFAWHEDDREYGDPSYFSVPRVVWD
jgi:hypothetical protein